GPRPPRSARCCSLTPRRRADHADRSAAALDVREALRGLSPEHRDVLVEVYFRGASVAEAATALGIPAGTVEIARLLRAALPAERAARIHPRGALKPDTESSLSKDACRDRPSGNRLYSSI
ncbi:Sigma-70, region 4, partial [Streptomyces sp. SolWspMP-sol7th]